MTVDCFYYENEDKLTKLLGLLVVKTLLITKFKMKTLKVVEFSLEILVQTHFLISIHKTIDK